MNLPNILTYGRIVAVPLVAGLILWGGKDRLIPPVAAGLFHEALAHSQVQVFPGLGHVPQEEDPLSTVRPVYTFLHSL